MDQNFAYFAFISYKRENWNWASWLQKNLMSYRLPAKTQKQHPLLPRRFSRVFLDKTNLTYGIQLEVFFPDYNEVQRMVQEEGINLFYNSIESRHRCCQVRKLEPLQRAFKGLDAWICGLRREQSVTRQDMQVVEWDAMHQLIKVNPLISWTEKQVWDYIKEHQVPYNKLHKQGYPSIGCEPCTRAVKPGEDVRAGRWWWESPDHRECGLHQKH